MSYNMYGFFLMHHLLLSNYISFRFSNVLGLKNLDYVDLFVSTMLLFKNINTIFNLTIINGLAGILKVWQSLASLVDLFGNDAISRKTFRLEMYLLIRSVKYLVQTNVRVLSAEDIFLPSFSNVFPMAKFLEREVWDMYGLFFLHNDQRRILSDYGFKGHPLRKDFPTTGFFEVRYDEEIVRIVQEPLALTQMFRLFDFLSPWRHFYNL